MAFELVDQWIYSRLNTAIAETESYLNKYALDEAAKVVYEFIRGDFLRLVCGNGKGKAVYER